MTLAHIYLSTACLHAAEDPSLHERCGSGYNAYTLEPKKPAECKYCPARCVCECHRSNVKPTVSRVVHYVSYGTPGGEYGQECRAAIVTQVGDDGDMVGLAVLNPTGMFFNTMIAHDEGKAGGTWHWPEREG